MNQKGKKSSYDIRERKKFVGVEAEDEKRLKKFQPIAAKNLDSMLDTLYEHFKAFPETNRFLQSEKHIANLKKAQREFFMDLLGGVYEDEYLETRLSVGRTHERIGLEPVWYIGAYLNYLNLIMPAVFEEFGSKPKECQILIQSINKMIFLDMGFAIETYIEAMKNREEKMKLDFMASLDQFSGTLESATTSIVSATAEQSATVNQQVSSVQEVTTTVAEVKQTSEQATEHAQGVINSAEQAVIASKDGTKAVETCIEGMHDIQKQVEAIADKILGLSEQTQQIGEIIQSVNEIAEQSKLLALNAAIEAARAGEHGKGFSVVASEIRNLADQSKQSTNQVRGILGEIQKATNSAVIATEEGSKKVEAGVELANQAGENIHRLSQAINASADSGKTISSSSQQQSAGVEQISAAMAQISEASKDSLEAVRKSEEIAKSLGGLAREINQLVNSYKEVKEKEIEWKLA